MSGDREQLQRQDHGELNTVPVDSAACSLASREVPAEGEWVHGISRCLRSGL